MPIIVKIFLGAVVGAAIGYGLHRLIGCSSGACPIWSSPAYAMLYGAGLGALILS